MIVPLSATQRFDLNQPVLSAKPSQAAQYAAARRPQSIAPPDDRAAQTHLGNYDVIFVGELI